MRLLHNTLRRRANPGNHDGFTLIELLVATFVSVIIMAVVSVLFLETQRHNITEKARGTLIREARQLISVTGDGFYESGGLRGSDQGACVSPAASLPGPWPLSSTEGTPTSQITLDNISAGGLLSDYYTLRVNRTSDNYLLYRSNTAPGFQSGSINTYGEGFLTNAMISCDDYAVKNADGYPATIYTRFNLSDPDTKARMGTDIVHEEIWALYTLNIGRRL